MIENVPARSNITILMIDPYEEHRFLAVQAFVKHHLNVDLRRVQDGEEAMDYLLRLDKYQYPTAAPKPDLIMLSLLHLETLADLKSHPELRKIPLALITSINMEDLLISLTGDESMSQLKPITFDEMIDSMGCFSSHWFDVVQLPEGMQEKGYFTARVHEFISETGGTCGPRG